MTGSDSMGMTRSETLVLDDRIRGVPPGTECLSLDPMGVQLWHPAEGIMTLPVLTMDEAALEHNRNLMLGYVCRHGAMIAPHAKTPMVPAIAIALIEAGAWGTTVADIRQAAVMLKAALTRLIIGNKTGAEAARTASPLQFGHGLRPRFMDSLTPKLRSRRCSSLGAAAT